MWLCTKLGFFSIVRKAPDEVHVRARAKADLENLKRAVSHHLGAKTTRWKIHRTEPADYRYRIVVSDVSLQGIMQVLALELDYSNFKGIIAQTDDQRDKLSIYSQFHHEMEHWQERPHSRGSRAPAPVVPIFEGLADLEAEYLAAQRFYPESGARE